MTDEELAGRFMNETFAWHGWNFWSLEGLIRIMYGDAVSEVGKAEIEMDMNIEGVLSQPCRLLEVDR